MSDPKRWLDEGGGGTAEERELLASGRDVRMPSALRKRVWLGIAAGVAGVGASAGTAAGGALGQGATAKGTLSLLLTGAGAKTVLAVALLGGAGIGVAALRSARPSSARLDSREMVAPAGPPEPAPASRPAETRSPETASADDGEAIGPATEHKPHARNAPHLASRSAPAAVASTEDTAPSRAEPAPEARAASRLREESAAVVAIRRTLVAGDAAEALRMLDRARADFPNGALVQEREALTVRALAASGQVASARKRGEAFLRAFPGSPHAAEVRALLAP
jgi:hypothetical protein